MAKEKTIYVCNECGGSSPKWLGKCPHCNAWNSLVESVAESAAPAKNRFAALAKTAEVATLADIEAADVARTPTGQDELDRVLGGGIVEGGVVLIGGDPGIGKSTLLLQAVDALQRAGEKTLYVTGEESGAQVALRARRLGLDGSQVQVLAEIQLEKILATLEAQQPAIAVIDSIQTVYSEQLTSAPGSVAQVRECAAHLTRAAKASGTAIVLVGHVTKEGALAGPRVLEHMVDTVLYFEGDTHSSFRLIRAIKNRFGAVNEIGVFAMTEKGLKGVSNPSAIFLSQHAEPVPGYLRWLLPDDALTEIPEGYDLLVVVQGKTLNDVASFIAEKLSTIKGVLSTATRFRLKSYKERGILNGNCTVSVIGMIVVRAGANHHIGLPFADQYD